VELNFVGGSELVKFVIDRSNKKLMVATSKTNYQLIPTKWKMLFDKGKEIIQERMSDKLSDEDFKKAIIMSMQQQGYALKC
jgi:hypothetical protein